MTETIAVRTADAPASTAPRAVDVVETAVVSRPRRSPLTPSGALAVWVVGMLSLLMLWGAIFPLVIGAASESRAQQGLFAELREQLASATAPVGPTGYGRPVALLDAPGAGLRGAVVVEGTSAQDLQDGPGHRRDTVLPGQVGTSVLLGKATTYGAPFRDVPGLSPGDAITVTTGQGTFRYLVERVRRAGDLVPPVLAAGGSRLVLVTADGGGALGALAPSETVYVDALLEGKAEASPGGRPASVPAGEQPMGTSSAALLPLVFWLQALLVLVAGSAWLGARWGRRQTWLVSAPALLAVIVGASTTATRLLPNLL